MTVFVTGAGGFIGQNLIASLAERGYQVKALVRRESDQTIKHDAVNYVLGDIMHMNTLEAAMNGCDSVIHMAAYVSNWAEDMGIFRKINVNGFQNIVEASKKVGVKRIVLTSTAGTLGPQTSSEFVTEKTVPNKSEFNIYEETKAEAEELAFREVAQGLDIVIVNPTRIYGPGQAKKSNVGALIKQYAEGKWRILLGDGNAIGNYGFVTDVVEGHILALEKGKSGERYILGGENLSYREFFQAISEVIGKKYMLIPLPYFVAVFVTSLMAAYAAITSTAPLLTPKWVKRYLQDRGADLSKAQTELGYQVTPFREGVRQTLEEGKLI